MAKRRKQKEQPPFESNKPKLGNTSSVESNSFVKGMVKDPFPSFEDKQNWTHARNAANNSIDGDLGVIGNEPSNLHCVNVTYTVIGAIHLYQDKWAIFSTDDDNSEIGLFDDSECTYEVLVNDECLNFNRLHLIKGAAKENYDCTWQLYWDDGNNPSRSMNINDIPWKQIVTSPIGADCIIYEDTTDLDCEKIRLAPLVDTPCVKISKGEDGGQLRNGSYQVFIAYTENEQKTTDYIGVSNIQSLWDHMDTACSLNIEVSNLDKDFDYYEVVLLSIYAQQTQAKKIGLYSTETTKINIDYVDQALPNVSLRLLPLQNPAYEKSDDMFVVNDYLIRKGPREQFDFNYQPLANQITAHWVSAEYDSDYYYKGGSKPTFLRDEQYAFFIRFIYNTGERSASYHIPGRPPRNATTFPAGVDQYNNIIDEIALGAGPNQLSSTERNFEVFNTAIETSSGLSIPTDDGGTIIASGDMAYWESTEKYPSTRPDIWDDLCGKHIRHHKFPTEETSNNVHLSNTDNTKIRLLGVEFKNIARPLFNNGTIIPNIVGFEFLRGTREGNKSILGKGIFRNMRKYEIPDGANNADTGMQGLYPNYPYNDLRNDKYFIQPNANFDNQSKGKDHYGNTFSSYPALDGYKQDVFTFHSPELSFRNPFLNAYETRMYGSLGGKSTGHWIKSEKHPQHKLLRNSGILVAAIFGIGYALEKMRGRKKKVYDPVKSINVGQNGSFAAGSGYVVAPFYGLSTPASAGTGVAQTAADAAIGALVDALIETVAFPLDIVSGGAATYVSLETSQLASDVVLGALPGTMGGGNHFEIDGSELKETPPLFYLISSVMQFLQQSSIGAQKIIDFIYELISVQDYALKYNSHGFFRQYYEGQSGSLFRTKNTAANYISNTFTSFAQGKYKINNLQRPKTVAVETKSPFPDPVQNDVSRIILGSFGWDDGLLKPGKWRLTNISAHYGAIKFNQDNQYGQLDGVRQIQMRGCVEIFPEKNTPDPQERYNATPIFGGDNYVNRFTEKVIMPIFTNFQYDQPDETPFDYLRYQNLPLPRYWMDTQKYNVSKVLETFTSFTSTLTAGSTSSAGSDALPSGMFYLDRPSNSDYNAWDAVFGNFDSDRMPIFNMKNTYMYTHVNGILDFYTESEINLAQRDWEDNKFKTYHYDWDQFNDIDSLFDAEFIRESNYYKYDYSLSAAKFITNLSSFGTVQPRDYDPLVAEKCYQYYPKRLIYSLRAQQESKKDFWRVFLPANYKDFKSIVNTIRPINQTGALMLFPYESPKLFKGVDTLQTSLDTKIIIGDGGLFNQEPQNIVNSDLSNEYGSCESARSVINTPLGIFFISQEQGKIFQTSGQGLAPISDAGMKWWFNKYLPCQLLKEVPSIEGKPIVDNPVIGVGCQTIYDPTDGIVYFCKRDYAVTEEFSGHILYDDDEGFQLNLTTYSGQPGVQSCPDGYSYNSVTGKCEKATYSIPTLIGDNQYECNEGETLIQNSAGQWLCEFLDIIDPIITPRVINISLGDPIYFTDSSWTVSYDPKVKAWISFHDWHPELCLPSINHFLTTKSQDLEIQCDEGYTYNPATGACERGTTLEQTRDAEIIIDEVPPTGTIVEDCPVGELVFTKDDDIDALVANWDRWCITAFGGRRQPSGNGPVIWSDVDQTTGIPSGAPGTYFDPASTYNLGIFNVPMQEGENVGIADGAPQDAAQANQDYWWYNSAINKYIICINVRGTGTSNAWQWTTFDPRENYGNVGNPTSTEYLTTNQTWNTQALDGNDYTIDSQGNVILASIKNAAFPKKVRMPINSGLVNGYWSKCEFGNYTHEVTLRSGNSDNDFIGVVLAAIKDVDGIYGPVNETHNLILMFSNATQDSNGKGTISIYYNYGNSAYAFLDPANPAGSRPVLVKRVPSPWNGGAQSQGGSYDDQGSVRVKVEKTGTLIDIFTTETMGPQANAAVAPGGTNQYNPTPVISLDLANVATWTDAPTFATGNELLKFQNNCKIGFFTFSQPATYFYDIAFEGEVQTRPGCDCPTGYTQVWENPATGYYTEPTGPCPGEIPLICRKIDCDCPPDPFAGGDPGTPTGSCDDLFQVGDPSYVNPSPRICTYTMDDYESYFPPKSAGSIWRHNDRCDDFAGYYGVSYPWEIEFVENTGQMVNTLRSIEYQLESFVYKGDLRNGCGDDRYHDLFWNFDEAVIYNSEQVSGLLKLNLQPQLDPVTALDYPIFNPADIDIIFNKVEQKYRFNMFWDITNDRGEFSNAEQQIWNTQLNGYIKDLNFLNLDYNKPAAQRKKFRHYYNKLILRRSVEGERNRKMLLKVANTKLNQSFR
tara:strand:+ start:36387 stop:43316 length:6930 start_codon:yes stop_codon:yes gene_type:complete